MGFKVGDKVKVTKQFYDQNIAKEVFEIIEVRDKRIAFRYVIKMVNNYFWRCPVYEYEIEKIATKGQQLLFSFMEQ